MQKTNSVARLRTIKQCLEAIKEIDPDTAITEWYIRQLCKSGKIVYYESGNKRLVNLDSLIEFLNRGVAETIIKDCLEDNDNEQQ